VNSRFGSLPRGAFALAATLLLALAGYLFLENQALRRDVTRARAELLTSDELARRLQQRLDQLPPANVTTAVPRVIASFVLSPGRRGAGEILTIALPPGSDVVRLQLPLEGGRFASFTASLHDARTNQVVWQSAGADLHTSAGPKPAVIVTFPAALLKPRAYLLDLQGVRADGASEPLGPYVFQVMAP
jgi:hypothetical protein